MRTPKQAIVLVLLVLLALGVTTTYAGYLVVGTVAGFLGTGHFAAGLLLGLLFARFPSVREGKWTTIGILPKDARLPVMLTLLVVSVLKFLSHGQIGPALILLFAASLLLAFRWMKQRFYTRVLSPFSRPSAGPSPVRPQRNDDFIIDAEFREKKD